MVSKKLAFVFLFLLGFTVFSFVYFGVVGNGKGQFDNARSSENTFIDVSSNVLFWKLVSFGVLLAGVGFMWDRVVGFLDLRKEKIKSDLESAAQEKLYAEKLLSESQVKVNNALKKANQIISDSKLEARKIKAQILEEAKSHADKIIEDAKKEISLQYIQLFDGLKREAGNLSVLMASKIIKKSLNVEDHQALIRKILAGHA